MTATVDRPRGARRPGARSGAGRAAGASATSTRTTVAGASTSAAGAPAVVGSTRTGNTRRAVTLEKAPVARVEHATLSYYLILWPALLLLALGVVMVLSASTITSMGATGSPFGDFLDQVRFVLLGLPLAAITTRIPVGFFRATAWPVFVVGLILQTLIFTPLAASKGGNTNWIVLPGIGQSMQPSEFLKLALALWLGAVLAKKIRVMDNVVHAALPGLVGGLLALLLVLGGNDMGTAIVLVLIIAAAYFVAGLPLRWFALVGVIGAGLAAFLVFSSASRTQRVAQYLGLVESDPLGAGLQPLHGMWALGTGGISGIGLGASREKWNYLPEAHNDFIFAIIGEELGLAGTLLVLALLAVLALGMVRVVRRHTDPFVRIAAAGLSAWILGQALINIGVVVGLLPVLGVPLPLVSSGGSALIATLLAIGVLLAFARSEPGAQEAFRARPGVIRRSLAVIAPSRAGRRYGR